MGRLKVFWWLAGLVSLLLLPSVLLTVLWVGDAIDEVNRVDNALKGVAAIEALYPTIKSRTEDDFSSPRQDWMALAESVTMDPTTVKSIKDLHLKATGEFSDVKSIAAARDLVRLISRSVKLMATTPSDVAGIPNVITDQALTVAEKALQMVQVARRLKAKTVLNTWDRMALPVQGGQFKATSDAISRTSRVGFGDLNAQDRQGLEAPSAEYRKANLAFQQAAGGLVRSLSNATSGLDLDIVRLNETYPAFARANNRLWMAALKTLETGLQRRKNALWWTLMVTSVVGVLSILIALICGIAVSRAFANRTKREIEDVGFHDPLTGLPNRRSLLKTLDALLPKVTKTEPIVGLLHIDLIRFKAVNDAHGEPIGDALLRDVATSLTRSSCRNDSVMRTGGNEFVVICHRVHRSQDLKRLAEKILQDIARPRLLSGVSVQTSACIGLAATSGLPVPSDQLLMDAALALRSAKGQGTAGYQVFESVMRQDFEASNAIAGDLRTAMDKGHIEPWYQPQVCIETGRISGYESLVRWVDPERGIISPGQFLPIAEEVGLMEELDGMMRREALASTARLHAAGIGAGHIGLNITAALLSDPDMVDRLTWEVEVAGLTPNLVSIEVLESVMIDEAAAAPIKKNIERLSNLGFFIELDDFGTGHSGLSSLRDLKVNRVKIDRSFVSGIDSNPELATFTNALIQLALSLNIEILAEGVETEGEWAWLQAHGCQIIQGYLISKALPENELIAWLSDGGAQGEASATDVANDAAA